MTAPVRIQLSRAKGWRIPENTVKVDRSTKWGNPAVVGIDGNAAQCVYWYVLMICGYIVCQEGIGDRQREAVKVLVKERVAGYPTLRGKNLACWCRICQPCHADALLLVANRPESYKDGFDMEGFMEQYGYKMVDGTAVRIK